MRKVITFLLVITMIMMFSGCGETEKLNEKVSAILSAEEITQQQLDEVFTLYDALSDKEKAKITSFDEIEKYRSVNIETVNEINRSIEELTEETSFEKILELQEDFENLKSKEKDLVNKTKLEKAFKLSDLEKAAIAACQAVKKCLKNPSSFESIKINVGNDLAGETGYYLVEIKYSATNSFGGRNESATLQTINKNFESPLLSIAVALGTYDSFLNNTVYALDYFTLKDAGKVVELDCNKIMYYIDEDVAID